MNDYLEVLLMLLHRAVDDFDIIEEFPIKKRLKRKRPEALALELSDDERMAFLGAFDDEIAFRSDLQQRWNLYVSAPSLNHHSAVSSDVKPTQAYDGVRYRCRACNS